MSLEENSLEESSLEESSSQQIKAEPEDGLGTAVVGLDDDGPVFRLPFASRVGERKGHGQHGKKFADPVGVNKGGCPRD